MDFLICVKKKKKVSVPHFEITVFSWFCVLSSKIHENGGFFFLYFPYN